MRAQAHIVTPTIKPVSIAMVDLLVLGSFHDETVEEDGCLFSIDVDIRDGVTRPRPRALPQTPRMFGAHLPIGIVNKRDASTFC